jgi:hypothetical protein
MPRISRCDAPARDTRKRALPPFPAGMRVGCDLSIYDGVSPDNWQEDLRAFHPQRAVHKGDRVVVAGQAAGYDRVGARWAIDGGIGVERQCAT